MCNYCEGGNQDRTVIIEDKDNNPLTIWDEDGKTSFLANKDNFVKINFCPMCGRKLNK